MKITKSKLRQIIKEELNRVFAESTGEVSDLVQNMVLEDDSPHLRGDEVAAVSQDIFQDWIAGPVAKFLASTNASIGPSMCGSLAVKLINAGVMDDRDFTPAECDHILSALQARGIPTGSY